MEQVYTPKRDYKVLVRCFTYNQSKYIEDALNGFAMQKTDFPFVCLVMDDASTDGEQEVIKAWMERECDMDKAENVEIEKSFITLVPHKSNSSCTFAFYFLKENLYRKGGKAPMITPWREHCEYEALCEGDDYWIAENKLQKQLNVLVNDKEIAVVYSKARVFSQTKNKYIGHMGSMIHFDKLICSFNNAMPTSSIIESINVYNEFIQAVDSNIIAWMGDYPFNLYVTLSHKVYFIDEEMSVYRVTSTSASHNQDETKLLPYYKSIFEVKSFFLEKSGVESLRMKMCHHYLGFVYKLYCRLRCVEVEDMASEVYLYMNRDRGFERFVNKVVLSNKIPWLFKRIISEIYSRTVLP